ncbi:hypothetical protein [Gordonia sp. VNK21]|uniref:hypothetical protein n=1 Tax=Gordonia sp. VNK21 TaxID=3382483 RepID=UPI0038D3C752
MAELTVAGRTVHLGSGRLGMGSLALVLSALLAITAGLVMWGRPDASFSAGDGLLRSYQHEPSTAWAIDDADLPGYSGSGAITVDDHAGDDWLLAYPSGLGRSIVLVDGSSGRRQWSAPVRVGLGDCAINADHQIGCAIKLGDVDDGFYRADHGTGELERVGDLDDTARVTAVGRNFLRVNQTGYQAGLRTLEGREIWSRVFAAAVTPSYRHGTLTAETADGSGFVLDPKTGDDITACTDCRVRVYPGGVLLDRTALDDRSVSVHPRRGSTVASRPVRSVAGLTVLNQPSTLPVLTATGSSAFLSTSGHFEIIDPATGDLLWQIADDSLSKANSRPCGDTIALARLDRSRVFFDLADGTRLGELPPPAVDQPDRDLDKLDCVGSAGHVVVYGSGSQLTAYDADAGKTAWMLPINGTAGIVDGYLVLTQGTSLSVLRPN